MNPYSDVASNMLLKDRVYNTLKNEIIGHRVVIASHKDRVLPQYAQDFISITKEVFAGIATVLPGRPRPFN